MVDKSEFNSIDLQRNLLLWKKNILINTGATQPKIRCKNMEHHPGNTTPYDGRRWNLPLHF